MSDQVEIIPGSLKRSSVGGLEFKISAGDMVRTGHIQAPHLYTSDELARLLQDAMQEVADEQAAMVAIDSFLNDKVASDPTLTRLKPPPVVDPPPVDPPPVVAPVDPIIP